MKKYHEYCEIVSPYRYIAEQSKFKNAKQINVQDFENSYVLFGTTKDGNLIFLQDDNGKVRYFFTPLDAANYLSRDGWYLTKTFVTTFDRHSYEHWIMAREVED